jgi:hypothetical protein
VHVAARAVGGGAQQERPDSSAGTERSSRNTLDATAQVQGFILILNIPSTFNASSRIALGSVSIAFSTLIHSSH